LFAADPLWNLAEELLDDPFVGLHVAQRVSRETFGIFSYVAYMLGFSETAPFFRAFKKWTGQTPGEFRKAKGFGAPSFKRSRFNHDRARTAQQCVVGNAR
jgi:AraC-like DNA-binding protein